MKRGKTAVTMVLMVSLVILSGWTSFTLLAQKNIPQPLSPDGDFELIPKRVDIEGLAWQVYLKLMDMGRRSLTDSARPVHIKSIFTVMNL